MKLSPRILALMSVVVLLSAVIAVPALAAVIDYNDYVTKVQVDGDNDLVTVKIPAEFAFVMVFDVTDGGKTTVYRGYGDYHDFTFELGHVYSFNVSIFGYPYGGGSGLDLSYIPVGTQIASGFGFDYAGDWEAIATPYMDVNYQYYEQGSGEILYYKWKDLEWQDWEFFTDTYVVESVDDANVLTVIYNVTPNEMLSNVTTGIVIHDTTMVFSISSLLRQQQLTGKTNDLLKEVESQLAAQGKTLDDIKASQEETNEKLDDIINGEVNGEAPDGSDIVDDYESAEDELMDSVSGGSDTFDDMTLSAWDKIYAYSQSFLAFGVIFELFADLPFIQALLHISLSIGTFAFLLNLGYSAGRALSRRSGKAAKRGG